MKEKLSADFERRLFRLEYAIRIYKETGNFHDLFPSLYSCAYACWCDKPVIKVKVKDNPKN